MRGSDVDDFGARLAAELSVLGWKERNDLLVSIGKAELRMRNEGAVERPTWRGPVPEPQILGHEVVLPTEQGERRGKVICFGVMPTTVGWERSVIVHVPSSGTHHEGPGSAVRLADEDDIRRMREEVEMAQRLTEAAAAATRGPADPDAALRRARKRGMRDPKLIDEMVKLANDSDRVVAVEDGTSNYKITGRVAGRRIYVFKSQLRVDISGFSVDHPAVRKISEEEARDMHLGKVRGQLLFDERAQALAGFTAVLEGL